MPVRLLQRVIRAPRGQATYGFTDDSHFALGFQTVQNHSQGIAKDSDPLRGRACRAGTHFREAVRDVSDRLDEVVQSKERGEVTGRGSGGDLDVSEEGLEEGAKDTDLFRRVRGEKRDRCAEGLEEVEL